MDCSRLFLSCPPTISHCFRSVIDIKPYTRCIFYYKTKKINAFLLNIQFMTNYVTLKFYLFFLFQGREYLEYKIILYLSIRVCVFYSRFSIHRTFLIRSSSTVTHGLSDEITSINVFWESHTPFSTLSSPLSYGYQLLCVLLSSSPHSTHVRSFQDR